MPELPEVETITRQLDKALIGREIRGVEVLRAKSFGGDKQELVGKKIKGLTRRAKMMIFEFENWDKLVVIHLKMTGQLIFDDGKTRVSGGHPTADWVKDLPGNYTRVIVRFLDGTNLFFNDLRVFGWARIISKENWKKITDKLPLDVTDKSFTSEYFARCLTGRRPVKLVLTDQAKIGGIGNIYANDALYLAKIYPGRKVDRLSATEIEKLYKAVKEVIALGIKYGGASVDKYVDLFGRGGKYQEHFQVYGQEGEKCQRSDGGIIKRLKMGGRGTFFCPVCQK